jgi:hypothetical protein
MWWKKLTFLKGTLRSLDIFLKRRDVSIAHVIQQEIFSTLSSIPALQLETNEGMEQMRQIQLRAFIYDSQGNLTGTPENLRIHVHNIPSNKEIE